MTIIDPNQQTEVEGFGCHQRSTTTERIILISFSVLTGALAVAGSTAAYFLLRTKMFIITTSVLAVLSAIAITALLIQTRILANVTKPVTDKLYQPTMTDNATCALTKSSKHSHEVRLEMIKAAQSKIVFAGSYSGDEALDEILEAMEEKLENGVIVDMSVVETHLTDKNLDKIKELEEKYEHFYPVVLEYCFFYSHNIFRPGQPKHYHFKGLSIDEGQMMLMGGSCSWGATTDSSRPSLFISDETSETEESSQRESLDVGAFHDIDIAWVSRDCHNPSTLGKEFDTQIQNVHQLARKRHSTKKKKPSDLTIEKTHRTPTNAVLQKLGRNRCIRGEKTVTLFTSAPEQSTNPYQDTIHDLIQNETREILIEHMYFHPSKEMRKLLADAVNRGVQLTIVHNQRSENSPGTHNLFNPQSQIAISNLIDDIDEDKRSNLHIYEYNKPYTTLHKKFMVFSGQETTVIGSSNICYASIYTKYRDYETDIAVQNSKLTQKAKKTIEADIGNLEEISDTETGFLTELQGGIQDFVLSPFL